MQINIQSKPVLRNAVVLDCELTVVFNPWQELGATPVPPIFLNSQCQGPYIILKNPTKDTQKPCSETA